MRSALSSIVKCFLAQAITGMYIPEAGFLVRVHPELCLILSRAQIRALLCSSKSKFIPAQTITLLVLDKKKRPLFTS
jgi:hypothetical protein